MLPKTLALVDDDRQYTEFLSEYLRSLGIKVDVFDDSNDLLAHVSAFDFDFFVIDLMLPGVDGVELIKVIRKRSVAGLLVVSGRLAPDAFNQVILAGADMYLAKPVQFEQVGLAIRAVQRRVKSAALNPSGWHLDRQGQQLIAPDGARIDLSETDLALVDCFAQAAGEVVPRETLRQLLGKPSADVETGDSVNAAIYRLRRRIERATPCLVPLQSKSGVGYQFRAQLSAS
ncbi:response regulator transcription factor [Paucibacter sediminis]|uniref:Response regulator transcription factor n=1 Tax=Paucibacter sediminis TaxID=3019553 RepID=A0AA95NFM9_9BURK|nr:response regulator transcription factor [Paucibacter sp. S2-9]WIT14157.1 response regulator transcription factor [Paucibacter sp. S2-9]